MAFSDDGRYVAATDGNHLEVWSLDGESPNRLYATNCVIGCSGVAFAPGPHVEVLSVSGPEPTSLVRWRPCR